MKKRIEKKANKSKKSQNKHPDLGASAATCERKFWTMRVEPMEQITIAENVTSCLMVIQNHGPGKIGIHAGYGDQMELMPGKLRVTRAFDKIYVESNDGKSALIELEFMPTVK
jgi:hypothetical protein